MAKRLCRTMFINVILSFVICLNFVNALTITQIMYNPEGADTGREWIELSTGENDENHTCVNLTGYRLFEEGVNHNIYSLESDIFCRYAIICSDPDRFLQEYPLFNSTSKSLNDTIIYRSTFSLSNNGELLAIKDGSTYVDYINYSLLLGYITVDEGYSLEYVNYTWRKSYNVSGNPKIFSQNLTDTNISDIPPAGDTITDPDTAINTSENISITINASISENISENISLENISNHTAADNISENNTENNSYNHTSPSQECNVSIHIRMKNESGEVIVIHENGVPIKFYNRLEFDNGSIRPQNYSIEYWVEDLSGNIIKEKAITGNQDEKSFTPRILETDKLVWIKSRVRNIDCSVIKNEDSKMLIIRNAGYSPLQCPECRCEKSTCKPCTDKISDIYEDKSCISSCNATSVRIVNVCNDTTVGAKSEDIFHTDSKSLQQGISDVKTHLDNNSKKGEEGMATGMIVYESPNLKNRFYAVIGLVLVGLAFIILSLYRWYTRRAKR